MKISIVIPAFNEERVLSSTLEHVKSALAAFTSRGWETEIIVCDNNSSDRTAEIARLGKATVVFEPINQIARARNCGAAAAVGDWLIFVDADSHPSRELFADVAEAIVSGRCVAGGSTVRLERGYPLLAWITGFWNTLSRVRRWMAGSFIFCEHAAFKKIGGFSHELFAAEELDLSERLKKLAAETGRKVVILHRHPIITSARKARLYSGREHLAFLLRAVRRPRRTLTSREACFTWYDGRR